MTLFQKAVKHAAKLRLAIAGPSGSGKTYTALAVGTALANGGKVAVIDTEHGSASKYADIFSFDVFEMEPPFHPDRFSEAIQAAAQAGYNVVILDSLSHAWNGPGGLLEIVDQIAKRMRTSNSFAAWKDATPIQNALIEAIVGAKIHVIATMRSKQEYVLEQVDKGGRTITVPKKVGMAPVQRDSFEYEFDVYLDMTIENDAIVGKTRCPALTGRVINKPGADLAETLRDWLSGEPAPEKPTPPPVVTPSNGTPFTAGASVSVKGKNDERPGTVIGKNGDMIEVKVDGKTLAVKPERLTLVQPEQGPLFDDEPEPQPDTTYSE